MIFNPSVNTYKHMKTLGLKKFPFSTDDLTSAFRNMVKKHHPDTDNGNKEMTRKVIEAKKALENLVVENVDTVKTEGEAPEGLTETCNKCHGTCVEKSIGALVEEECTSCTNGKVKIKCRFCSNGRFKLKSGRKVACKICAGTGTWRIVNCKECKGRGTKTVVKDRVSMCRKCKGHGKVKKKVFNPVIPEGAILTFSAGSGKTSDD
jgi:hypothetical protein